MSDIIKRSPFHAITEHFKVRRIHASVEGLNIALRCCRGTNVTDDFLCLTDTQQFRDFFAYLKYRCKIICFWPHRRSKKCALSSLGGQKNEILPRRNLCIFFSFALQAMQHTSVTGPVRNNKIVLLEVCCILGKV